MADSISRDVSEKSRSAVSWPEFGERFDRAQQPPEIVGLHCHGEVVARSQEQIERNTLENPVRERVVGYLDAVVRVETS